MTVQRSFQHAAEFHGPTPPPSPSRRRSIIKAAIIYGVIGIFVGVIIVVIMKVLSDPAVSTGTTAIDVMTPTPAVASTNELAGLTFDLKYPSMFDLVANAKNATNSIEQYNVTSKTNYRRSIAVTVFAFPTGKIDEDSSYKFRLNSKADYKQTVDKLGGEPVYIMSKSDNTERTLFWTHGGKLLIVAITSTAEGDDVSSFMATVMPTIRWRT